MDLRALATRLLFVLMLPLIPLIAYAGADPGDFWVELRRVVRDAWQMFKDGRV